MTPERFASTAGHLIDSFDSSAHHLIEAWRDGGERLGVTAKQRWNSALKESSPKLDAQTRRNAMHAQKVFGGYYTRGVEMSAAGAAIAVDTLVQAARVALARATASQQARA